MAPLTLQQLHKILAEAGFRCRLKQAMEVVEMDGSCEGRFLGMRPSSNGLQIAYAWARRIDADCYPNLATLIANLNARIPCGAWIWNLQTGALTYKANCPWPQSGAGLTGFVARTMRFHARLLIACRWQIRFLLRGGAGSVATKDALNWCQPQLEALPAEERVSSDEWGSIIRGFTDPTVEAENAVSFEDDIPF